MFLQVWIVSDNPVNLVELTERVYGIAIVSYGWQRASGLAHLFLLNESR